MRPYLEPNPLLATLIEWGGLVLVLLLVLSPFAIILLRRFRPTRWRHIIFAYISSFAIFFLIEFILGKIDRWLLNNYLNTAWIQEPIEFSNLRQLLLLLIIYPISTFYSVKLLYGKFTKKRFFVSFGIALLFLATLLTILAYAVAWALNYAGRYYF